MLSPRWISCCLIALAGCQQAAATDDKPPARVAAQAAKNPLPELPKSLAPVDGERPDKIATALRQTPIYPHAIRSVAFSPNGKVLAAGTGDGVVRLWDVEARKAGWTRRAHSNWVFDLTFTPDGHIVSGGGDDSIEITDSQTGAARHTFDDHTNDLHGVAVTSDGKWLISGGDDTRILARSLQAGTVQELGSHDKQVTSVTISSDDNWAASSSRDGTVKLWNLQTFKPGPTLQGHTADVMSVAFSNDGNLLVTGSYDRTVRLWNVKSGEQMRPLGTHDDWVFGVLFSKDNQLVFTGCGDDALRVFRVTDGKLILQSDLASDVSDLALSPDGKLLAAATSEGVVRFIELGEDIPRVLHERFIVPRSKTAPPVHKEQTAKEYLDLHRRLVLRTGDWVTHMAGLSMTGDAFSLYLLRRIDEQKLQPADAEVRQRVISQIENHRRPDPDTLRLREIGPLLYRASVADLGCDVLEAHFAPWLIDALRKQSSTPEVRQHLLELKSKPPVPAGGNEQLYGAASERIRKYIDTILIDQAKPTEAM